MRLRALRKTESLTLPLEMDALASFHRKAEALQRASEPGSCVSIACTLSEHLNARPSVARLGDGETASVLFSNFRTYPQGFAQLLSEKGACVTCFPFRPIVILLLEMTES